MKGVRKFLIGILGITLIAGIVGGYERFKPIGHESAVVTDLSHSNKNYAWRSISAEISSIPSETFYQNKVVIVTFHDISPNVYSPYVVTPSQFAADLDAIQARFHVITNQQFILFLSHRTQVPSNSVLLTFDDGYRGMYTYALPQLLLHHMQGTFFEIAGTADDHDPAKLTWDQIRTMSKDGMVFGSHTYNSHYEVRGMKGIMVPVFDTRMPMNGGWETLGHFNRRIYTDFLKARVEIRAETGQPIDQFAWPFGWGIPESTYIAKRVGYTYIYTTTDGCVTANANPIAIPRIDIGKPWISPLKALQLIIHYSHVIPSPVIVQFNNHHSTEVNVYVHSSKQQQGKGLHSSGTHEKGDSTGKKLKGSQATTGAQNSKTTTTQPSTGQNPIVPNPNNNTSGTKQPATNSTNATF